MTTASPSPASPEHAPPPRGTRPRDRREQIRAAAAALFYERGYDHVSVADVARSVNVGPSALYRHFSGKADLLYAALELTVDDFAAMIGENRAPDVEGLSRTAARTALKHRALGVLWQREARNLPDEHRTRFRHHLGAALSRLSETVREVRPDLDPEQADFLATALVNTMSSISFHQVGLPDQWSEQVLIDLARAVLTHRFVPAPSAPTTTPVAPPHPERREQIVQAATALFSENGFDGVGIDEIGAAVGIAGPSLYHHFASKQDLLLAVIAHADEVVRRPLQEALASSEPPEQALRHVTEAFAELAREHADLLTILLSETRSLGTEHQDLAEQARRDHLRQWIGFLQRLRPGEDPAVSRTKVIAAQMLALALSRSTRWREEPRFRTDLKELCWELQQ